MSGANPSASGGQEPPASSVGQEPTKADAKSAQTKSGQESGGVNRKTKKLRKEAEGLRARLREAEKAKDEALKGQQSEAERKDKRLAELEAQAAGWKQKEQEHAVKLAVVKAATKRGLDSDLAEKLLNWSELKFDEETGEPKGVGKVLDKLLEQYPMLKSQPQQQQPTIGATNPQQSSKPTTGGGDPLNPPRLSDTLKWE